MQIDPVILIAEDLRLTGKKLSKALQDYSRSKRREDGELVDLLLRRIKQLFAESVKTAPTSVLGAAELLTFARRTLPCSCARYASHLHDISERFAKGARVQNDLIWLRAFAESLDGSFLGKDGKVISPWIRLAILGASRPILVFRSVHAECGRPPWQSAIGKFEAEIQDTKMHPGF